MSHAAIRIPVHAARAALAALLIAAPGVRAQHNAMGLPYEDLATSIKDRRGVKLPLDLEFVDENRKRVRLGDYFGRQRPVLLNLGYFGCPTICGVVTQGMVKGLNELTLEPGRDFEIVTVSIDPREKPELARDKKNAYLGIYTAPGAGDHWHFLTGDEPAIRKLADAVGFSYEWNEHAKVYDHGAGIFIASAEGVLSQTLLGTYFDRRTLRLALVEASDGQVGTAWDRILLNCYGYDPEEQRYTLLVWTVVRIGGGLTVAAVAAMIFLLWRRERRRAAPPRTTTSQPRTV